MQNAVSRLRRLLGKAAIETRAPGYVLRVEPGAIDTRRFERLVHEARPLPPAERSAGLRDALGLWRGSPFADLGFESFLQAEVARLDELRLTALEDRRFDTGRARAPGRRDPRCCPARCAAPRPRTPLPSPDARARTFRPAAGGTRRVRGDAPRPRRAVGSRAVPRDPRAAADDPHAGDRHSPPSSQSLLGRLLRLAGRWLCSSSRSCLTTDSNSRRPDRRSKTRGVRFERL